MRILPTVFLALFLGGMAPALAERMECKAQVTTQTYSVSLDTESRELHVETAKGYRYAGTASYFYNARTGNDIYFLSTGFSSGFEMEFESTGQKRIAFCLKSNECYLCKP